MIRSQRGVFSAVMLAVVPVALAQDASPAFHNSVMADSPLLWYQFNESVGNTAFNHGSLGPGHDGTYFNGPLLAAPSLFGDPSACFQQSAMQYLRTASNAPASLLGNPSFSCEAVVYVFPGPSGGIWPPMLFWGLPGTGNSVYFSLSNSAKDRFYAGFYNGGLRTTATFAPGQWYHVVMTRDSGGGANNSLTGITLYVNGQAVATEPDPGLCCNGHTPSVDAGPFYVQNAGDSTRYFSGDIDEVALYDRVLTASEVKEHYDALVLGAACPADCDLSGSLDVFDFLCFQNNFVSGSLSADCDRSTCSATLDVFDFLCFQNAFAGGCQ